MSETEWIAVVLGDWLYNAIEFMFDRRLHSDMKWFCPIAQGVMAASLTGLAMTPLKIGEKVLMAPLVAWLSFAWPMMLTFLVPIGLACLFSPNPRGDT